MDDGSEWCYPEAGYWINEDNDNAMDSWKITKSDKYMHFYSKPEIDQCFANQ